MMHTHVRARARARTHILTYTHKKGKSDSAISTRWTLGNVNDDSIVTFKPHDLLDEKIFYYSVLESSWNNL